MPTTSNLKKNKQLGMSHGKACAILRREIFFKLLKESNKNTCYRCNKKITKIETFSIDHKKPWLNSKDPIRLFFDLRNIAFSHSVCNSTAGGRHHKIIYPKGEKWCTHCKRLKKLKEFPNYAKKNRDARCTSCNSERQRERRKKTGLR